MRALLVVLILFAALPVHAEDGGLWTAVLKYKILSSVRVLHIDTTSADIEWTDTTNPQPLAVRYGTDVKVSQSSSEECTDPAPCLHLSHLMPGTVYEFRIPTYSYTEGGSRAGIVYEVGGTFRTMDIEGHEGALLSTTTTPRVVTITYLGQPKSEEVTALQKKVNTYAGTSKPSDIHGTTSIPSEPPVSKPEPQRLASTTLGMMPVLSPEPTRIWYEKLWNRLITLFSSWL